MPWTGDQHLEIQSFDLFERFDPVIRIVALHRAIGDRLDRNEIDGEQQSVLRKKDHEAVIRVVLAGVDQFEVLATEIDKHPIRERQIRNRSCRVCGVKNFVPRRRMADKGRLVGKDAAAGDVVVMVVAVHHIAHRLIGELL